MLTEISMPYVSTDALVIGAFAFVVYFLARRFGLAKHGGRLPPGPPGHWLMGNPTPASQYVPLFCTLARAEDHHAFNHDSAYLYYTELAETYGPVFTLKYGSRRVCVIGRHQVRFCFYYACTLLSLTFLARCTVRRRWISWSNNRIIS